MGSAPTSISHICLSRRTVTRAAPPKPPQPPGQDHCAIRHCLCPHPPLILVSKQIPLGCQIPICQHPRSIGYLLSMSCGLVDHADAIDANKPQGSRYPSKIHHFVQLVIFISLLRNDRRHTGGRGESCGNFVHLQSNFTKCGCILLKRYHIS